MLRSDVAKEAAKREAARPIPPQCLILTQTVDPAGKATWAIAQDDAGRLAIVHANDAERAARLASDRPNVVRVRVVRMKTELELHGPMAARMPEALKDQ